MPRWQERRARFRSVLSGNKCVYPGSGFNPISARITEELGFEVGMFAGSVASMTVLGAPDLIVLTLTEFEAQAATHLPRGDSAAAVRYRYQVARRSRSRGCASEVAVDPRRRRKGSTPRRATK